ncbi:hypothetical protein ZIOFF_029770 [Zingiber officinale]|uniref:UDP-3-O-acyl-N-acetylglucosamine deacetylase n=1 Tax=Zingiber officinale TaxID=94328 RepID=A0A8J5LGA6_ZINOF|nr:hypothetical protein ZIOFF_029770 [Zingiber officinale]
MPSPLLSHSRRLLSSHSLALTSISRSISRNSTGRNQQTLASSVTRSGTALHSGNFTTVRLIPAAAGEGRYFVVRNLHSRKGTRIPASIDHVVNSALCTTLCRDGVRVRTVEHLLSALEACGVDNCRIEIDGGEEFSFTGLWLRTGQIRRKSNAKIVSGGIVELISTKSKFLKRIVIDWFTNKQVPLLDGSAKQWVEAIKEAGLYVANDHNGCSLEKLVPKLHEPLYLCHRNSFLIAFPSPNIHITYGIDFSKVLFAFISLVYFDFQLSLIPAIATQWFSSFVDESIYCEEIASARTFCIYEEVEGMRQAGLIKGGSVDNAIVCSLRWLLFSDFLFFKYHCYFSATAGWLNPPLRFSNEPCRHKVLDLVGDVSLFAQNGNQGLPIAHIIAYKAGHALHADFVRLLSRSSTAQVKD